MIEAIPNAANNVQPPSPPAQPSASVSDPSSFREKIHKQVADDSKRTAPKAADPRAATRDKPTDPKASPDAPIASPPAPPVADIALAIQNSIITPVAVPITPPVQADAKPQAIKTDTNSTKSIVARKTAPATAAPVEAAAKAPADPTTPAPIAAPKPELTAKVEALAISIPPTVLHTAPSKTAAHATASAPIPTEAPTQPEQAHTMVATPNVLEVGISGGTHGWLRIRAELGTSGEVSAQVLASSAGAAENLGKELPAISAYLATEQVGISSLVVNAAASTSGAADSTMSFGAGGQSGANSQSNQPFLHNETPEDIAPFSYASIPTALFAAPRAGGGWLSVRV